METGRSISFPSVFFLSSISSRSFGSPEDLVLYMDSRTALSAARPTICTCSSYLPLPSIPLEYATVYSVLSSVSSSAGVALSPQSSLRGSSWSLAVPNNTPPPSTTLPPLTLSKLYPPSFTAATRTAAREASYDFATAPRIAMRKNFPTLPPLPPPFNEERSVVATSSLPWLMPFLLSNRGFCFIRLLFPPFLFLDGDPAKDLPSERRYPAPSISIFFGLLLAATLCVTILLLALPPNPPILLLPADFFFAVFLVLFNIASWAAMTSRKFAVAAIADARFGRPQLFGTSKDDDSEAESIVAGCLASPLVDSDVLPFFVELSSSDVSNENLTIKLSLGRIPSSLTVLFPTEFNSFGGKPPKKDSL
mmetsp:Transcript_10202/g.22101  ORF Transcript_10202/g.22101 Transcript_10202/m.22101 type:complete len:364 (-) Transcript_10202:288-1379(-)